MGLLEAEYSTIMTIAALVKHLGLSLVILDAQMS